jgi:nickel-dependent lactate racemase
MNAAASPMLDLEYGSGVQHAEVPPDWNITTLSNVPWSAGRSERSVIASVLANPIAAPALGESVSPTDRILILVSDKTRRCRTEVFLPILLGILERSGIPDEHITILFATGTHPGQSEEEQKAILGTEVWHRYRVREHDARDDSSCVHVGTTRAGTDIRVNRLVTEADRVIATGTIVHHYFAGFGGGAKLFVPGVAGYQTAVANHRRTVTSDGRFHEGCTDGRIDGNPVITDILDAIRFMPPAWYFAALLDEEGQIADGVCGDLLQAHAEGCRRVDARYRIPIDRRADLTIVGTGGYPKDINLIQAHKSLHHAAYATREGGSIIFLAECREGIGNEGLRRWFEIGDAESFRRALLDSYEMNAHTALALREKAERFRIHIVSDLPEGLTEQLGMHPAASLQDAIEAVHAELPEHPHVAVLRNASLLVPDAGEDERFV